MSVSAVRSSSWACGKGALGLEAHALWCLRNDLVEEECRIDGRGPVYQEVTISVGAAHGHLKAIADQIPPLDKRVTHAARNNWPMGVIVKTVPSRDGLVRKVELKVVRQGSAKIYSRPISKLVLLLSHEVQDK
ncbi:hypothetical protein SKAU_G00019260 [Synaphobranchus kaupii]|uniref:DUF5641 domain-containing protein n=1 Tax=Synaphobranchus kaupii TaxID=118154 RepID=A0A9Q1JCY9_SYNKA|nr:hypothetical protein SKAU_G00019260 [Synaphobranchus kaupii]